MTDDLPLAHGDPYDIEVRVVDAGVRMVQLRLFEHGALDGIHRQGEPIPDEVHADLVLNLHFGDAGQLAENIREAVRRLLEP